MDKHLSKHYLPVILCIQAVINVNIDVDWACRRREHDHIASDLFNIHVVTEFSRDVIILTYNGCVLKLNR